MKRVLLVIALVALAMVLASVASTPAPEDGPIVCHANETPLQVQPHVWVCNENDVTP